LILFVVRGHRVGGSFLRNRRCRQTGRERKMVTAIEIDELKERIDRGDSFVLANASTNVSVCAMDAIKGTYCIPRKALLGQLGALFPKSAHVVLYCVTVECAEEAARELDEHGYTNVEYVKGTLGEWKDKGYPTESLWPAYDWHD
jgi:rhodanese-related sulfurtransferase